ncbi:MAG: apolipoprotein N-acyltransferase [Candidatus Sericytochromatia bacterium]|nr:apolipoprotein N-acyltransferase [Candidatus Sericytochromatia bacterium]
MTDSAPSSPLDQPRVALPPDVAACWRGEAEAAPGRVALRRRELAGSASAGVLLALAYPGFDQGWLAYFALIPLCFLAFVPRGARGMAALFTAFGAGFNLTSLYWFLAMHPLTWLGFSYAASLAVVTGAWLAASALLVLQFALFGALFGLATERWRTPRWAHVAALACGWTALEWLTSLGTFGFTWGNMALSQVHNPAVLQMLELVGPYPLAGVLVTFNGALALAVLPLVHGAPPRRTLVPAVVALDVLLLVSGYGWWRLRTVWPSDRFSAAIVQGNIHGADKWTQGKEALPRMAGRYIELSAKEPDTDLVLWPETAVPEFLRNNAAIFGQVREAAVTQRRHLMFGTLDWEGQGEQIKLYNAVGMFGPDGTLLGFDYKRHLVPYGEYVPGRAWMPAFLLSLNIVGHDYYPGTRPHLFDTPFGRVGTGVCYDGIFPDAIRPVVASGATVLTLVTNDAWYKDTAAPRVLLAHAVLRAVENRRWVLRAANTGISAFISPAGQVTAQTPVFQDAVLRGKAAAVTELTPYTRWGDWLPMVACGAFGTLVGLGWIRRRRPN